MHKKTSVNKTQYGHFRTVDQVYFLTAITWIFEI